MKWSSSQFFNYNFFTRIRLKTRNVNFSGSKNIEYVLIKYVFHAWIRTYVCKRYQFLNISKLFIIITLVGKLSYIISQWAKIRKKFAIELLAIYTTVCFKIENLWLFKIFSKTEHPNSSSEVKRIYEVKKRCQKASI